jgi:hypothetical protein
MSDDDQPPGPAWDDDLKATLVVLCDAIRDLRMLVAQLHDETGGMTGRSASDDADVARALARIDGNLAKVAKRAGYKW